MFESVFALQPSNIVKCPGGQVVSITDPEVSGLNPAGGGIQLMTVRHFIAHPFIFIILPSSQYHLKNVKMDIKHQIKSYYNISALQPSNVIKSLHCRQGLNLGIQDEHFFSSSERRQKLFWQSYLESVSIMIWDAFFYWNCFVFFQNLSPAVHVVDLGASPCNVKVKPMKRLSDENINAEVKAAKIPLVLPTTENEIHYIKKAVPTTKKVYPCTPDRRAVTMVSPITKSITKLPESSKVNIFYIHFFLLTK